MKFIRIITTISNCIPSVGLQIKFNSETNRKQLDLG